MGERVRFLKKARGNLRCCAYGLALAFSVASQPSTAQNSEQASRPDRDCAVIIAIARDRLEWGKADAEPETLIDLYDYLPRCDWRRSGLPAPTDPHGRAVALGKPRYAADGLTAFLSVRYPRHCGGTDLLCSAILVADRWQAQPCRFMQEVVEDSVRRMVEMSRKASAFCASGSARLKSGGDVDREQDYECIETKSTPR
jgi:hypothetical protein